MRCRNFLIVCFAAASGFTGSANGQTTIDVSKITCNQFLAFRVADPIKIGIWLSGYYHGLRKDASLDVQGLQERYDRLKSECYAKPNERVLDLIESMK
jgi:hypothetical protein